MIKYRLKTPKGGTSKVFTSMTAAYKFLKKDSPDLEPRDIFRKSVLKFADGYTLQKTSYVSTR